VSRRDEPSGIWAISVVPTTTVYSVPEYEISEKKGNLLSLFSPKKEALQIQLRGVGVRC